LSFILIGLLSIVLTKILVSRNYGVCGGGIKGFGVLFEELPALHERDPEGFVIRKGILRDL
jgi:hypothetical protein